MAINQRAASVIAGAALGAYTSDITDNPLTGLVSTGIGAGIGSMLVLPKRDIKSIAQVPIGATLDTDSLLDRAKSGVSKQVKQTSDKYFSKVDEIFALHNKVAGGVNVSNDEKTLLSGYKANLRHIGNILKDEISGFPADFDTNPQVFMDALKRVSDNKLVKKITPLLSHEELNISNLHAATVNVPLAKSYEKLVKDGTEKTKISELSEVFQKQMGNSVEEANQKAKMLVERSIGPIQIKNGSVILSDRADGGKSVTIPITHYDKNGIRYHNSGDGKATSVKGFTPYLKLLTDKESVKINGVVKQITEAEVRQGMAPEMMLQFLDKDKPISSMLKGIKSHYAYNADEVSHEFFGGNSFEAKSPTFINNSRTVTTDMILNVDDSMNINSKRPLRKVKQIADKTKQASEETRIKGNLHEVVKDARNMSLGISGNSSTDIQSGNMRTISLFAPLERNVSGSVLRQTVPNSPTRGAKAIQQVFGKQGADVLYSSAQVLHKLDIADEKAFNKLSVALLGDNSKVLGDGFGLYNRGHGELLANKSMKDIKIPLSTSTIIKDKVLFEALESGDINNYIKTNGPVEVGNGILGFSPDGSPIEIGKQHSSGRIVNAYLQDKGNNLVLRAETIYNPNKENLVKIFSTGSKALATGVGESKFNLLTALGSLLNQGQVEFSGDKLLLGTNAGSQIKQYIGKGGLTITEMQNLSKDQRFMEAFGRKDISVITSAERTGMDKLQNMLKGNEVELLQKSGAQKLIDSGKNKRIATIAGFLTLETKAAEDLTSHVTTNLLAPLQRVKEGVASKSDLAKINTYAIKGVIPQALTNTSDQDLIDQAISRVSSAFRSTMDVNKFIGSGRDAAMESLYKAVELSGISQELSQGYSTLIGSTNKGGSIVGAGNKARVSWNAYQNMTESGFSRTQLGWLGKTDDDLIYEMQGVLDETKRKGFRGSFNEAIAGSEGMAESLLANSTPEERLAKFQNTFSSFSDQNNPYLTYDLAYDKGERKSLNFSLISTNRNGKYDFNDTQLIKDLDKHRLNVMSLDLQYQRASDPKIKKKIEEELKDSLSSYEDYTRGMFSGDNNILKNTLSLYTDVSSISVAQPIGGVAQDLINSVERNADGTYKAIANKGFMSSEGIEHLAGTMGIDKADIMYQSVTEKGFENSVLKRAGYMEGKQFIPFSIMSTREPAQGILSSQFMEVLMDPSIKGGKYSLHFAQGQYGFAIGQNGDFDQDALQVISKKFTSFEHSELSRVSSNIRKAHEPYLNIEGDMSPKNNKKGVKALSDFDTIEKFDAYQTLASAKGKIRKNFSPLATTMATNYKEALRLEYGNDIDKKTLGRIGTYRSIENLIKSSHIDTDEFKGSTQPIEELSIAREKFLSAGGSAKDYSAVMREHLPGILGKDETNAKKAALNKNVDEAVDLIIKAELNQAKTVNQKANSPISINKIAKLSEMNMSIEEAMAHQNMFDVNRGVDMKRSSRQLYQGLNDAIVDTIKSNKSLLAVGAAALVGINLMGRSEPSFADSRANMRMHSTQMLQSPTNLEDIETGIETNTNRSSYVQPKSYTNSKSVQVNGQFIDNGYNSYNQFSSMLDPSIDSQAMNMNSAIFGGGLRSAKLDITDL